MSCNFTFLIDRRFRWVVCRLDALRKCRTTKQIATTLTKLQKTLNDIYVRILENIDEDYCRYVHDILILIAFSMRPLKLSEIVEAIAFDAEKKCFSEEEKLGDPLDVLEICSSLISLPARWSGCWLIGHVKKRWFCPLFMVKFRVFSRAFDCV